MIFFQCYEHQNLKTSARHSGGKLTVDLANEVLRDADVTPIIGVGNDNWDHIKYDSTYYFPFVRQSMPCATR